MGCNNSKPGHEAEAKAMPSKIHPLLRLRFDEIRRRTLLKDQNLSDEKLLKDGPGNGGSSPPHSDKDTDENKSGPSSSEDSLKGAKLASEPGLQKMNEESAEEVITSDGHENGSGKQKQMEAVAGLEEALVLETNGRVDEKEEEAAEEKDQEEEEEEEDDDDDEAYICPGSPSFRVYCVQSQSDEDDQSE